MTLCDVNVWLALVLSHHVHHRVALAWWLRQTGARSVLFCRTTQQGLLRLLTTEAALRPYGLSARSMAEAWAVYRELARDHRVSFAHEPDGIESAWERLTQGTSASPKAWIDAYLVAFAEVGRYRLVTFDQALGRFESDRLAVELLA